MKNPSFIDVQSKKPLIAYIVFVPIIILMIWAIVQQVILGKPFGENPASDLGLIAIAGLVFITAGLLLSIRLNLQVNEEGIKFRLFPLSKAQFVSADSLSVAEVIRYKPFRHFGGWGLRWGKYGTAYTLSGSYGLRLETKRGRKILIGTQKPKELQAALNQFNLTKTDEASE